MSRNSSSPPPGNTGRPIPPPFALPPGFQYIPVYLPNPGAASPPASNSPPPQMPGIPMPFFPIPGFGFPPMMMPPHIPFVPIPSQSSGNSSPPPPNPNASQFSSPIPMTLPSAKPSASQPGSSSAPPPNQAALLLQRQLLGGAAPPHQHQHHQGRGGFRGGRGGGNQMMDRGGRGRGGNSSSGGTQRHTPYGNNSHNQKKPVEEKDKAFYCKPCDKGYHEKIHYSAHVQKHEKCPYEGCAFEAVEWIVEDHVLVDHVGKLLPKREESPEEISAWIEERKSNFPSVKNVIKKNAAIERKFQRGELIDLPRELAKKLLPPAPPLVGRLVQPKPIVAVAPPLQQASKPAVVTSSIPAPVVASPAKVDAIAPTVVEQCGDNGEDKSVAAASIDVEMEEQKTEDVEATAKEEQAIESEDDAPQEISSRADPATMMEDKEAARAEPIQLEEAAAAVAPAAKETEKPSAPVARTALPPKPCHFFAATGYCPMGSQCKYPHVRKGKALLKNMNKPLPERTERPPSLLRKLLSKEVEEEKSIVLQALRYFVRKNFFQDEKKVEEAASSSSSESKQPAEVQQSGEVTAAMEVVQE